MGDNADQAQDELRLAHMLEDLVSMYGPRDPRVRQDFRVRLWVLLDQTRAISQAPLIRALTLTATANMHGPLVIDKEK